MLIAVTTLDDDDSENEECSLTPPYEPGVEQSPMVTFVKPAAD